MSPRRKILFIVLLLLPVLLAAALSIIQLQPLKGVLPARFATAEFIFPFYILLILIVGVFIFIYLQRVESWKIQETNLGIFTDLLENSQIAIRNMNNEIIYWNRGMEKLYGWKKEEVMGKNTQQLFSTRFPQPLTDIEKILFATNQWQGELTHTRKDGSSFVVSSHWSLNRDKHGIPFTVTESNNDITALKKSEERVTTLSRQIEQSNDAIFIVNTDRLITAWNQGAEKIYGFSSAEAAGREVNELLQTEMTKTELDNAVLHLAANNYWAGELKRKRKDGTQVYVYSSTSTIRDTGGNVTGYVGVSLDITGQVQLKNQVSYLASLVDQSSDAIVSVSVYDRTIVSWNRGAERLHGYSSCEAIGKKVSDLHIVKLTQTELMDAYDQIKAKGYWQSEMLLNHKNGSKFTGAVNVNLIKDTEGTLTGVAFIVRDITARKNLETSLRQYNTELENKVAERAAALHKNELRLRSIIENNYDSIVLMDESFKIIYRSPASFRITGFTDEEMDQPGAAKHIHPDDTEKLRNAILDVVAHPQKRVNLVYRFRHKKGYYISLEANIVNKLQDESVKALVFNSRDITERVHAEEKLSYSERHFRTLIENNYDVISLMDESFRIIYRSPSAARITGWTDEEMLDKDGKQNIHPEDRGIAAAAIGEIMANPGKVVNTQFRNLHKRGHYIWVEGIVVNRLHDENVKAIVFNYRDITERKETEEKLVINERRFRTLIENNYDVITLMDDSFKLIYRSPSASRVTGWTNEDMLTMDATLHIHPDDRPAQLQLAAKVMATPGKRFEMLFRMLHKKGHAIWIEGVMTNWLPDENIKAVIFNYRDITDRKETEKKLAANELRFRSLIENSGEMIALIDRDYNTTYRSPSSSKLFGTAIMQKYEWHVHPDWLESYHATLAGSIQDAGKPVRFESRLLTTKGYYIWVEGTVTSLLHLEGVNAIVINYRDITQRKISEDALIASENKFRSLTENSAEGISLLDSNSNVLYRSPGGYKMLGNTPSKDSIARAHPEDLEAFRAKFAESLAKPGVPIPYDVRYITATGGYFWAEGIFNNLLHVKGVHAVVANYRDVTKRKELENLLNKANALARIGGWEVDLLKNTVYWTDITREIHETGYDYIPDLESGLNFYKNGEWRNLISEKVKEAISDGRSWDLELPIITAKNNERWIRSIGETEFINGKCIRIYGSFQDISQRKEAEEKLIISENRFRSLIENIADAIVLNRKDFSIIYQSPSASKITGYEPEERLGKKVLDFVHPDYLQQVIEFNERVIASENTALPFQYPFLHKKGHYIWLEGVVTNLLNNPAVGAFVSNYRDVTYRKENELALQKSEQLYRNLFENMLHGFAYYEAIYDNGQLKDAEYLAVNHQYELLVGQTNLAGKTISEVIPGLLNEGSVHREIIRRVLQTGQAEKFETLLGPLGKWLMVSMYSPSKDHLVVLADDITERKQAEEKIQQLNAQLELRVKRRTEELRKTNEELEAFSYSVSHDLRAPLRGIIGFTAILEEEYTSHLDAEAKRLTGIIKSNTLKMGNLIDDLLMFSRMGRQQIEQSEINTNKMVSNIIAEIDHKGANHPVNWIVHPLHAASGDIATIRQVWTNLISNAVKYSATSKQPEIEILSYEKGNHLVYMVKDNGVGFDQKYSNKLFKVFQRLHTADDFEGTGVGLAIVEKIISKHGGKVWAEAAVNQGAAFYFSLPSATQNMNKNN